MDALGVLLGALGELLGVRLPPGGLGTLGVFLAAPGDPHKQRHVVTGQKDNDPPKQSMLSALTESEHVLVCSSRILTPWDSHALGITIFLE